MAELGITGFIFACIIVYRYFRVGFKKINNMMEDGLFNAVYVGIITSMAAFFINYLFSPGGLFHNWLWLGFGLTYAAINLDNEITDVGYSNA